MKRAPKTKGKSDGESPPGRLFGATAESRILRALRLELGLSQIALAKALGSHRCSIGSIERGVHAPSPAYVDRLAKFFGPAWSVAVGLDAEMGREKLHPGLAGRAEAMIADMAASATQHRVTSVMAPNGRRAVVCVALVDDGAAEALMARALQTAAACVEEG